MPARANQRSVVFQICYIVFHRFLKVFEFLVAWPCRLQDLEGARERGRGKEGEGRQGDEKEKESRERNDVGERGRGRMERKRKGANNKKKKNRNKKLRTTLKIRSMKTQIISIKKQLIKLCIYHVP